jgi:hypothetical protein
VRLYDKDSKHCGLFFNIPTIIPGTAGNGELMFVAVSWERARNVGGRGAGHSAITRVEGEIPLSDVDVYGPGEVVNVLLVTGGEVAERITVARIHLNAWGAAGPGKENVEIRVTSESRLEGIRSYWATAEAIIPMLESHPTL